MPLSNPNCDKDPTDSRGNSEQRRIPVDLLETTPPHGAALYWVLASPLLVFFAWIWTDVVVYVSPIESPAADRALAVALLVPLVVLLGVLAHRLVTSLPRLFHNAGWDVQPLQVLPPEEEHTIRFTYRKRHRAASGWKRWIMRAAQGWVYIEMAVILAAGLLLIPLYLSASRFGFGS